MWQPTRKQWPVIWVAVIMALGLWIAASQARSKRMVDGEYPFLIPYERYAVAVLVLGAMAIWHRSERA